MKTLAPQYAQFTPEERLRLTLAAEERGDQAEVEQLISSCPQMTRVVLDPRYVVRVGQMHAAVGAVIIQWMDVSALVILYGLQAAYGNPAEDGALLAKAEANWKEWSARWRGMEAGIRRFCADADLTVDQVLVLAGGRSAAIELARRLLHAEARANRRCENATRQKLGHAWPGGNDQ